MTGKMLEPLRIQQQLRLAYRGVIACGDDSSLGDSCRRKNQEAVAVAAAAATVRCSSRQR